MHIYNWITLLYQKPTQHRESTILQFSKRRLHRNWFLNTDRIWKGIRSEGKGLPDGPVVDFTFQCRELGVQSWVWKLDPTGLLAKIPEHKQQKQYHNRFNKDLKYDPHKTKILRRKRSKKEECGHNSEGETSMQYLGESQMLWSKDCPISPL